METTTVHPSTRGEPARRQEAGGAGQGLGVIVLGSFRSGTSLVCQLLDRFGVDFGPPDGLRTGDKFNPGGYYERGDVNHLNGRLVESAGRTFADPGSPGKLAEAADPRVFDEADLTWMQRTACWGLKDPRLCATLAAWVAAGRIDPPRTRIVHVQRSAEAVARSAMKYPGVNHYFGNAPEAICRGVEEYARLARWHVDHLGIDTFTVQYEELLEHPRKVVAELARFIGVHDRRLIRRAAAEVGKKKAHLRLAARRLVRRIGRLAGGIFGTT
jgi:hypothetical protein